MDAVGLRAQPTAAAAERRRGDARPRPPHAAPHAGAAPAGAPVRLGARQAARDPVRQRPVPSPPAGRGGLACPPASGGCEAGVELLFSAPEDVWVDIDPDEPGDDRGHAPRVGRASSAAGCESAAVGPVGRRTRPSTSCRSGRSGSRPTAAAEASGSRRTRSGGSGRWTHRGDGGHRAGHARPLPVPHAGAPRATIAVRMSDGVGRRNVLLAQPHVPAAVDGSRDLVHRRRHRDHRARAPPADRRTAPGPRSARCSWHRRSRT